MNDTKISITIFSDLQGFSDVNRKAATKMFGTAEKTFVEWFEEMKDEWVLPNKPKVAKEDSPLFIKTEEIPVEDKKEIIKKQIALKKRNKRKK